MRSGQTLNLLSLSAVTACDHESQSTAPVNEAYTGPSVSMTDGRRAHRSWKLTSIATAINNFVDVGIPGPTPGDIYVFVDDLLDGGQQVGQIHGRCNLLDPARAAFECTAVLVLGHGTLTTAGILINAPGATSVGSITGGTGRYRGASGELEVDLGGPTGPHELRLSID